MTEPLGIAIVGCAHTPHAMSYARALVASPNACLVGVHDESAELGERVAAHFDSRFYPDAAELVGSSGVVGVVICGATFRHRAHTELAASLGRHVLCEKPIATTLEDARCMIEACARNDVQLHSAFVTRFYPLVQQIRAVIASGVLGDLVGMVGGNRGRAPLPPQYPAWITTPTESGGGALIDHSVHVTDVMWHVSGRKVVEVAAEVDSLFWNAGVDDMALVSLVFEGGLIASVDPSWSMPAENPWHYDFYLRVLGTKGALEISDTTETLRLTQRGQTQSHVQVPFGIDIEAAMIESFLASIRAGEILDPGANGEDGLRALEIALAGYASARLGTSVRLPLALGG